MMDKIFFVLAMIVAFYLSISSIQSFNIKFESLELNVKDFKSGYIEDITVSRDGISCPNGYKSLVDNFDWPGNFPGCGCKIEAGSSIEYKFYQNYCPRNMPECKKVEETKPKQLNKWKGALICYKRSNVAYSDLTLIPNTQESIQRCTNSTHNICGAIDSKHNLLCLSKNISCPVTKLEFITEDERVNRTLPGDSVILPLDANKTNYMVVSKSPINTTNDIGVLNTFFRIDITSPCLNPNRSPSSELFFPLMKNKYDLSCDINNNGTEIIDAMFTPIDSISLEKHYEHNNFIAEFRKIINPFRINVSNKTVNIYAKPYPGWDLECTRLNPESLKTFLKVPEVLNGMLVSNIIHSFITIAIVISIGITACFITKHFEILFKLIVLGFILINLLYPIQVISNSSWVVNILTDADGIYCGDTSLNLILVEISTACLQLQYLYILILLVAIVSLIVLIYVIYWWVRPASKDVQEKLLQLKNF